MQTCGNSTANSERAPSTETGGSSQCVRCKYGQRAHGGVRATPLSRELPRLAMSTRRTNDSSRENDPQFLKLHEGTIVVFYRCRVVYSRRVYAPRARVGTEYVVRVSVARVARDVHTRCILSTFSRFSRT
eukprot:COSAG02_NODE_7406_length_3031_cov_3.233629_1_plen_130_part_00